MGGVQGEGAADLHPDVDRHAGPVGHRRSRSCSATAWASPASTPRTSCSKSAFGAHTTVGLIAFWLGVVAAFMTAFYSTRLMFMTFYGKYRGDHHTWDHAHESPHGHADPALCAGDRRRAVGLCRLRLVRRPRLEELLGPVDRREVDRGSAASRARGAAVGEAAAAGLRALGHRAQLLLLHRPDRPAGPHGQGFPGPARSLLQQVVLRRDLRCDLRQAGARDRPRSCGRRATAR